MNKIVRIISRISVVDLLEVSELEGAQSPSRRAVLEVIIPAAGVNPTTVVCSANSRPEVFTRPRRPGSDLSTHHTSQAESTTSRSDSGESRIMRMICGAMIHAALAVREQVAGTTISTHKPRSRAIHICGPFPWGAPNAFENIRGGLPVLLLLVHCHSIEGDGRVEVL